jgi:hypothetical protein
MVGIDFGIGFGARDSFTYGANFGFTLTFGFAPIADAARDVWDILVPSSIVNSASRLLN